MKHGRVLDIGHSSFNDKPENVANLLSYGGLNNLFYETILNNLMLDIISRAIVWRLVMHEPQTVLHNA